MSTSHGTNRLADQLRIAALEAAASRFQRFAQDAPIGILFIAADGSVQFANDELLRIIGRSREEHEAERFRVPRSADLEWLDPARGARYEAECVRRDGSRVPVLVGVSRQQDALAAFVIDLTAEKAAEQARRESEERYRAIAARLAEADRRKDEFLSVLSHELRNPLAPIRNAVHLLARAREDPVCVARARDVIDRQVGHLARMIEELLDVTRISRGQVHLSRAPLDLAKLVRETVEDHRAVFDTAGIRVTVDVPAAPVPVDGDATRLAQVLGNLLANSLRFTPRDGAVTVALEEEPGDLAALRVRDTGEGIGPELLPHVFEPFTQADRSLARTRGGLGLGLALVKGLVELHGGTVAAASAGRGRGAEITVRLPLAPAFAARLAPPAAAARAAVARVLVVEDNVDAADTLRDALELEGLAVTLAGDGAAALAAAREAPPDLVICDIGLPGELDGYGVARAIRADPALRDTPLVALTGYAGPEDRARAREAGFDRHFGKPTPIEELLGAIEAVVRDRATRRPAAS